MSNISYSQLIGDLKQTLNGSELVSRFYSLLYNKNIEYHINGFTMIAMMPPNLSGIGMSPESLLSKGLVDNILFAVDFTGVDISINVSSQSGYIGYASKKSSSGQVSCSYIDSTNLHIYSFHQMWINYIDAVRWGVLEPSGEFIDEKKLDYVASIYAVTFKPDMTTPVYTSKAIGIFPVSLGDKEIIGSRSDNSLATYSVSYECPSYTGEVGRGKLYNEFLSAVGGG